MRSLQPIILITLLLTLNSCVSGMYEMIRGYDKYVETNENGRRELIEKKFRGKFNPYMAEKIDCNGVYYHYEEDKENNYIRHSYLIFYKTGQYAYFASKAKDININELVKANSVGYYIFENNKLILETPLGNFNTAHFRVMWEFIIKDDELVHQNRKTENLKDIYRLDNKIDVNREIKPDW